MIGIPINYIDEYEIISEKKCTKLEKTYTYNIGEEIIDIISFSGIISTIKRHDNPNIVRTMTGNAIMEFKTNKSESVYIGEIKSGSPNGKGIWKSKDLTLKGIFRNFKLINGTQIYTVFSEITHSGSFIFSRSKNPLLMDFSNSLNWYNSLNYYNSELKLHGNGTMQINGLEKYKGNFTNGIKDGLFEIESDCKSNYKILKGIFINDKKNGPWTCHEFNNLINVIIYKDDVEQYKYICDYNAKCATCNISHNVSKEICLNLCKGCYITYYCSKKCQKINWKKHKFDCQWHHFN